MNPYYINTHTVHIGIEHIRTLALGIGTLSTAVLIVIVLKSWYQTSPLLIGGTRTPDLGGAQG